MELKTGESTLIFTDNLEVTLKYKKEHLTFDKFRNNPVYNDLVDEAGEEVFQYIEKYKLLEKHHSMILSSIRHYLFGSEEIKQVNTVISLKQINRINQIRFFLQNMNHVLPINGHFVGCFIDYKNHRQTILQNYPFLWGYLLLFTHSFSNRIIPRIPPFSWVHSIFNDNKIKCLTASEARILLDENGFHVIDVTEINGLSYFISKKIRHYKNENDSFTRIVSDTNKSFTAE